MNNRYEIINGRKVIIKEYDYLELVKGSGVAIYYFIPPDLISEELGGGWEKYIEEGYWTYYANRDLKVMGLTSQQYYNLYFLRKELDFNGKCKSSGCTEPTGFVNITNGYRDFCSRSCKMDNQWESPEYQVEKSNLAKAQWDDPEYKEYMSELAIDRWKDPEFKRKSLGYLHDTGSRIKSHLRSFMSLGDPEDICQLYLGMYSNGKEIKFGISKGMSDWRGYCNGLRSTHVVAVNTRYYIANLEAEIKTRRGDSSERVPFSDLPKILNIIREFKLD